MYRFIPVTFATVALFAQGPGPGGPRMHAQSTTHIQSYLNLTDAQISSLHELGQSERAALKPIFEQAAASKDFASLRQQAAPIRASFQQQAQAVLTPAQKTQLAALENAASLMPAMHEAGALNLLAPKGPGGAAKGSNRRPTNEFR